LSDGGQDDGLTKSWYAPPAITIKPAPRELWPASGDS